MEQVLYVESLYSQNCLVVIQYNLVNTEICFPSQLQLYVSYNITDTLCTVDSEGIYISAGKPKQSVIGW